MQFNREQHQPACLLAHEQINKLSAIIGFCDLLIEKAEERDQDQECVKRLVSLHDLAKSAIKTLVEHQCELAVVIRRSAKSRKRVLA
jgi:hypothetical protein